MKIWFRTIALSAIGAFTIASGSQAKAAGECVTIAHDIASGEKLNLDPARSTGLDGAGLNVSLYEALVDINSSFQVVPRLATSWKSNSDATQWTFDLRKGVKFHDGSDFDSADVVYTFKRLLDESTGSPAREQLSFLNADGIEAVDKYSVRFTTDKPVAQLPLMMKNRFAYIVPEGATTEGMESHAVGTGPFIIDDFNKSSPFWTVKRNVNYWAAGLPKSDCIRFTSILEPITRAAALISGDVDIATALDPQLMPMLSKNEDITLMQTKGGSSRNLTMLIDHPPFDDVRVRQALKAVVDRQAMVDGALLGVGEPGADNPIPPSSDIAFSHEIPKQDIPKAKRLLAEAGYPDGLEIELYVAPASAGYMNIAQTYVQMAAEAGITVKLKQVPAATYWKETWMKMPFVVAGWSARHPSAALSAPYRKASKWNDTHWYRDDYDALLDKADSTLDDNERIESWKKAQKLLAEEGGAITVAFYSQVAASRSNCSGYKPHTTAFYFDFREVECK